MSKLVKAHWKKLSVLSALSGIIYNSWPIGYWLNPYVARHDLASELEALRQPYNWLFISGDIVSSIFIIVAAFVLLALARRYKHSKLVNIALINTIAFAVGTIVDALAPLHCDPSVQRCQSFIHDPILLFHGFFSILASVCLFVTMALYWWLEKRSHLMNGIVAGYVLFSIFSIISIITPGQDSWAQHYALLLDGVCLGIIPFVTVQAFSQQKNLSQKAHQEENL